MTDLSETAHYLAQREKLIAGHAYDPSHEHDACGVGLIVSLDGSARRDIVEMAIAALKNVWHRGAVDADGKTGDGAGIRLDVPQDFFRDEVEKTGHSVGTERICVGQMFLPRTDFGAQERARTIVESELLAAGFAIYGWRQVPVDISVIGQKANDTRPEIEQILFFDPLQRPHEDKERALYVCRRRIEKTALAASLLDFYICSFSSRSLIYKGMFLAEHIDAFYPDLKDPRFTSAVAIYHQRYSTNTFPQWRLAQPFRMLAHNGEINTLKGNVNWMRSHEIRMASEAFGGAQEDVKPVIQPGSSDSAALDAALEILVRAGRDAPMAKSLLVPEAWNKPDAVMKPAWKALYSYCNSVMEPWDGPAALAMFDGRWAVAGMDRNGLRPMRFALTGDGVFVVGSESGMCPLEGRTVLERGRIGPGQMVAFDTATTRLYRHEEIVDELAGRHPYGAWLKNVVHLEPRIGPGPEPRLYERAELTRRQVAAGYTFEDLEMVLAPMGEEAKEAVGSMGDDSPLAVLSDRIRPLSHFFRQNFSQVTNPPIDPLREDKVMSLKTRFKNLGNILAQDATQTDVYVLESPVLTNRMYDLMLAELGGHVAVLDCSYPLHDAGADPAGALRAAIERIKAAAEDAIRSGHSHIVLTDEHQGPDRLAVPAILITGGVHSHLVKQGLRTFCSITVRSAECMDTHYFAVLVGVGATCVNAYLAQESLADRAARGLLGGLSAEQAAGNYKKAVEGGLLKILSKMGISVISSYRGGCNFEAVGLSRALVAEFFPGMPSRISGIGLKGIAANVLERHQETWDSAVARLPVGGFYKARARGETHALEAAQIHQLQTAVTADSYPAYKTYVEMLAGRTTPIALRDLLGFRPGAVPVPLEEVENVNEIRKRFVTPGMSLGALSPEAHGTLNIAMNRIGAKSVSGEGGEDRTRYTPLPNGDNANSAVKQIASGRFGVTAEYLNQCREIEIKVAQGAKPGEGGQLPGFKVTELIARLRHATPGVSLISPPPHHDIYSIEDLAQLIYDLKQINPEAKVCVKLVSQSGVGTVAAGVAKAKADIILIAGNVGGTGASPQTSVKYAGIPWEMGLAEAHQVLSLNNLRDRVVLRTDGGLKTGRDIVIAAILGAEEFGIGTASLVAMGCIMVRQCHSNTCPVGVCTQDPALRERFTGTPEKVIHLMDFIATEVREILASLGFRTLNEIVGRTDLIAQVSRGRDYLDELDLNPLLVRVDGFRPVTYGTDKPRVEVPDTLDAQILADARPFFEQGIRRQLSYRVRNVQRAIGTRASSAIVRRWGLDGLEEGRLHVKLEGSCGQSLGAFAVRGLTLDVVGDANDYVGKGLSGATIIVRPAAGSGLRPEDNTIIGNTCLYGATSGWLLASGQAGERFAVRNSGARTVVEGCGSNGCEYMTGGVAVILGAVGFNFAAGMSGGMAYVYDPEGRFPDMVNPDSVIFRRVASAHWRTQLEEMVERHVAATGSPIGTRLLEDFDAHLPHFWQIVPKEMLQRLPAPLDAVEAA